MTRLSAAEVSQHFAATLNLVNKGDRIILFSKGKNIAALVPMRDLKQIEETEDRLDAEDFGKAMRRWEKNGKKSIPWEQVEKEMGI